MLLDGLRADAVLGNELDRWEKEVQKKSPLGGVEIVQVRDRALLFQSLIAEVLPDVCPPKESFGQFFPSMCALSFL